MSSRSDTIHPTLVRIDLGFINLISNAFKSATTRKTHPVVALVSLLWASRKKVVFELWTVVAAAEMGPVSVLRRT